VPFLAKFFRNHGLLDLANRPQWFTVSGSSRRYVRALAAPLTGRCQLNRPIERLVRGEQGITLHAGRRQHTFDAVILAVHSDTTLRLLAKPSEAEQRILGAIQYQPNTAVVHCDSSVMPRKRRAWASWNAHMLDRAGQPASITYWLNRLQNFSSAEPVYVTLGAAHNVRPEKVLRTINYQHPVYSHAAVAVQRRWHQISGRRGIHYCGAYWRNGFHEDGVVSALAVTQQFGLSLENLPGGSAIATSPQRTEANLLM
jgi:predicted NAD/FAD-binding protein